MSARNLFKDFDRVEVAYTKVGSTPIETTICVPKNASGECPVLVRFHGGALINGARMFEDWIPQWLVDYTLSLGAIWLSPDYRLLPESTGLDILSDLSSFWTWLQSSLADTLSSSFPNHSITPRTSNILAVGDSAGGYLAIQSAFLCNPSASIGAVIAAYPMLDLKSPWFTEKFRKVLVGNEYQYPRSVIDDYLKTLTPGKIMTAADPPLKSDFANCTIQQGCYADFLGQESKLYPFENIDKVEKWTPMWIFHGQDDSIVPAEGSLAFVKKVKGHHPDAAVMLSVEAGEHGFDNDPVVGVSLETEWVKDGLAFVGKYYP